MGTTVDRASAVSEIRQKAEGYGIPNERVEGMDIMAVRRSAEAALEYVRAGNGPFFLEITTYRFRGHSMGDPERYRQAEEVKCWQENNDPIGIYHKYLVENNIANAEELLELDRKAANDITAAVQFAESSPEPTPEMLWEHIYADE
jgi:pyruvate dehydrogenase E1 component alpha subunit